MRRVACAIELLALTHGLGVASPAFTKLASGPGGDVGCFGFDTTHPGVTLAGSTGGLMYRSSDGGSDWSAIKVGSAAEEFRVIAQAPGSSGIFYAYSTGGTSATAPTIGSGKVYQSTDDGMTWTALAHQPPATMGFFRGWGRGMAIDPTGQIIVISDRVGGIYRSENAGQSWKVILSPVTNRPFGLAVDPTRADTLWLAGNTLSPDTAAIWKSTDFGVTWTVVTTLANLVPSGALYPDSYAIAVQPGTGTIFASYFYTPAAGGQEIASIARSLDGGTSWAASANGILPDYLQGSASGGIVFDPVNPSTIYLSTNGDGFYKSTDNGDRWKPIGNTLPYGGAFVVAARPATTGYPAAIFAGTPNVAVSTDSAASWSANNAGYSNSPFSAVADDAVAGSFYAISDSGLVHTTNSGRAWLPAAVWRGSQTALLLATDLTRSPVPIYVATLDNLWRSTDGGQTWHSIQPKLGKGLIVSAVRTDTSGNLYAPDTGNTLYRSSDEGKTWTATQIGGSTDVFINYGESGFLTVPNAPVGSAAAGLMYALVTSGLWQSNDSGATWALASAQPGTASQPVPALSIAQQQAAPWTLYANTSTGLESLAPGASSFTAITTNASLAQDGLAAAPGSPDIFAALGTSDIIGSADDFATSSNVSAQLAKSDSYSFLYMSATKTKLFVSDGSGSTFAAPYSNLLQ